MIRFLKYNLPAIIWAAVIFWSGLISSGNIPKIEIPNIDKVVHFASYLVLVLLMYYGWKSQNLFSSLHRNSLLKILVLASAYGLLIEIMQGLFTADRHFDVFDVVANASGAAFGSLISVKLFK